MEYTRCFIGFHTRIVDLAYGTNASHKMCKKYTVSRPDMRMLMYCKTTYKYVNVIVFILMNVPLFVFLLLYLTLTWIFFYRIHFSCLFYYCDNIVFLFGCWAVELDMRLL